MTYRPNIPVPDFKSIMGAPKKYRPEMCQIVIATMAQGHPKVRVAVELGVVEATIYRWRDEYPEFAEALKLGEQLCAAAWAQICLDESCGVEGAQIKNGGIMAMRNILGWDTRDKEKTDVVEEARAILQMGAQLDNDDWLKTYGPNAVKSET